MKAYNGFSVEIPPLFYQTSVSLNSFKNVKKNEQKSDSNDT